MQPFILIPLYLYPSSGAWSELYTAVSTYSSINFTVVINPYDGPGSGKCPDSSFITAISTLNSYSNVQTLGYVHTANRWNCGTDGTDICPCTQSLANLEANITKYANWPTASCSSRNSKDIHMDGIFFDEAPSDSTYLSYMTNATSFAKSKMTKGNTVLFNAGWSVDSSFWSIADYINIFEDTESVFQTTDISALTGNGAYSSKATIIVNENSGGVSMKNDVHMILSEAHNNVAGVYITDVDYDEFPSNFTGLIEDVAAVILSNSD